MAAEGKAIAHCDNKVIFIPFAVPGDIMDVQLFKQKKKYSEGKCINIKRNSDFRTLPFCRHFGLCGGCKWQILSYEKQLYYKENQIKEQLLRIGKINEGSFLPIIPSEVTTYYRNKLEFTFSNRRWLYDNETELNNETAYWGAGFHVPGRFDKVLEIKECFLQKEPSNSIRNAVSEFCKLYRIPFFDLKKQTGFIRNLIVRNNSEGQFMLIFSFAHENSEWRDNLVNLINDKFPEVVSVYCVTNNKCNDSLEGLAPELFYGKLFLEQKLGGLVFNISPKSFFQTNIHQALNLYNKVLEFAELKGDELVYDLYCGTGTISLFLAKQSRFVLGMEYLEEAVTDAWKNAVINQISNVEFIAGDIKNTLNHEVINSHGKPDIIVLDPPRNGIHKDVITKLIDIKPYKIIYVSCNPATQARDISILSELYTVDKIQPFDMFPHTHHVENIVKLIVRT